MPKQIRVESAVRAFRFTSQAPWACISIASQTDYWPEISAANRLGLLQIAFMDATSSDTADSDEVFSEQHAHQVLDFVKQHWPRLELLLVHCEIGRCRGSAVAAAISRLYLGHDEQFFLPGLYQPNPLVYRTLIATASKRGEISPRPGSGSAEE
jgi:predicted protein tyrosine phosphatase